MHLSKRVAFVKKGLQREKVTERKERKREGARKKNKSQKLKYRQQMQENKVRKERVTERKCHKK